MEDQVIQEQAAVEETTQETPIQAEQKASSAEKNFAQLRESKERAERERDEALQRMRAYEAQAQQKPVKQLREDDIPEWGDVSRELQRIEASNSEMRLKVQYPDFDAVVTQENIRTLREQHPEIAAMLSSSGDIYTKGSSAYKIIKNMGIAQDQTSLQEKEIAQRNAAKPRPLSSVSPQQGDSPLSNVNAFANGFTKEERARLWKEMQDATHGI